MSGTSVWRRTAALLQMSPLDACYLIGQNIDGAPRHEGVRDRISASVANRIAMESGPAPMDSGAVHEEYTEAEGDYVGETGGAC